MSYKTKYIVTGAEAKSNKEQYFAVRDATTPLISKRILYLENIPNTI